MKKQLPTHLISSELAQSSVFFQKPAADPPLAPVEKPVKAKPSKPHSAPAPRHSPAPSTTPKQVKQQTSKSSTPTPRYRDTTPPSNHDTMPPRSHEIMTPAVVETIRKAVKQVGKEAATHRFTEEEKQTIADIVYTYGRQGYRTSENEITRIAVNWLILDYQERGKQSVLARLLDALHE